MRFCKKPLNNGFTIVELLIVIVVIAILTAITIVSYSGIRDQAYRARLAAAVNDYSKAMILYHSDNPTTGFPGGYGSDAHCLGQPSDYPAADGFPAGACSTQSGGGITGTNTYYARQAAYDDLVSYMKSAVPDPKTEMVTFTRSNGLMWKFRGIQYEFTGRWVLMWLAVKGKVECPGDGKEEYSFDNSSTLCEYYID